MKKILTLCLLACFLQVSAQSTSFGVKLDVNMSDFMVKQTSDPESTMRAGGSIGVLARKDFGKYFALQPEFLLHMKNSNMSINGTKNKLHYWGFEIPVYAIGQLDVDNEQTAYIGIGPYVSLGLSAKNKDLNLYKHGGPDNEAFLRRFDFGFAFMAGYEFQYGLEVVMTYKVGVQNALKTEHSNAAMYNQSVSLGLSYRF